MIRSSRKFLKVESAGGIVLFVAALLALFLANSIVSEGYERFFTVPLEIHFGDFQFSQPFLFWINEGLMTIFFLLVGLELKREMVEGELSEISKVMLPGIAAAGGMLVPAVIYLLVNSHHPETLKGWAVPVATDIAFALGVLSLFGKRIPIGLKLFLMALAIFDDVGAIIIIAVFHTKSLSYLSLSLAGLSVISLQILKWLKIRSLVPFMLLGLILWLCVLKSGVHATVAGVLLAFMIPAESTKWLENKLHPWVAFLIMPLFALANAGISFNGLTVNILFDYVSLGIILGLFVGKQLGVFIFSLAAIKLGWAKLPDKVRWGQLYGVSLLCGIGFTMSLFLGTLAFKNDSLLYLTEVRLGVLLGSTLSGIIGGCVLYYALKKKGKQLEAS